MKVESRVSCAFLLVEFCRRASPLRSTAAPGISRYPDSDCNLATHWPHLLALIYHQYGEVSPAARDTIETTLWLVFLSLLLLSGIGAWLIVLAHEKSPHGRGPSRRDQTSMLMEEIEAHGRTDAAALQRGQRGCRSRKPSAKTRYIVGISHADSHTR